MTYSNSLSNRKVRGKRGGDECKASRRAVRNVQGHMMQAAEAAWKSKLESMALNTSVSYFSRMSRRVWGWGVGGMDHTRMCTGVWLKVQVVKPLDQEMSRAKKKKKIFFGSQLGWKFQWLRESSKQGGCCSDSNTNKRRRLKGKERKKMKIKEKQAKSSCLSNTWAAQRFNASFPTVRDARKQKGICQGGKTPSVQAEGTKVRKKKSVVGIIASFEVVYLWPGDSQIAFHTSFIRW